MKLGTENMRNHFEIVSSKETNLTEYTRLITATFNDYDIEHTILC